MDQWPLGRGSGLLNRRKMGSTPSWSSNRPCSTEAVQRLRTPPTQVQFLAWAPHISATMTSATSALRRKALVLNADYRPIQTYPLSLITAEEAICSVLKDRAVVVEEWEEEIRSPSFK